MSYKFITNFEGNWECKVYDNDEKEIYKCDVTGFENFGITSTLIFPAEENTDDINILYGLREQLKNKKTPNKKR